MNQYKQDDGRVWLEKYERSPVLSAWLEGVIDKMKKGKVYFQFIKKEVDNITLK